MRKPTLLASFAAVLQSAVGFPTACAATDAAEPGAGVVPVRSTSDGVSEFRRSFDRDHEGSVTNGPAPPAASRARAPTGR